jgi:hypothetical protein
VGLLCLEARAQDAAQNSTAVPAASNWAFSASVAAYFVPDDTNYVQPTVVADRRWLHLEARYNYEDRRTGSTWVGYNFAFGKDTSFRFTPMFGGVFGRTDGIGPGYRATLDWRRLELYSESEWVLNLAEHSDSFLYNWSEVTLAPWEWLIAGFVVQRTRVYQADRDVQRGFLVRISRGPVGVTANVFNPDQEKPLLVLSASVEF